MLTILVLIGVLASLRWRQATILLLGVWRFLTDMIFDLIAISISLRLSGPERKAAHQRLYDFENRLYVAISGYQSSFMFRAESDLLRASFPPIGDWG